MSDKKRSRFRPPTRQVLESPIHLIAFVGMTGLSPLGPGTLGTLIAVFIWFGLRNLPLNLYVVIVAALFVFGCWVCGRSAKLIGLPDYSGIVFDEVVGFLIAAVPLNASVYPRSGLPWPWLAAVFVLFRILDIVKPPPIGWLDRHVVGGLGIMLDDALAGLATAAVVTVALYLFY